MAEPKKLPSGTWRISIKHQGRRVTGTAPTRAEAKRLGAELLMSIDGNVSRNATVGELLAVVIADGAPRWSPTYRDDVIRVVDDIPEAFARRPARGVTPMVIDGLYRQLTRQGWSQHRLRRLHEVLSSAWEKGRRYEVVTLNPVAASDKPRPPRRSLGVPSHADVRAIIAAARNDTERLALRINATIGMRRGETVALRWTDIDFDTSTIIVRHSLVYTPASSITERDTKTGERGQRPLAVDPATMALLRRHRDDQLAMDRNEGTVPEWVFSDDGGAHPWRPDRLTHIFVDARKRAKVTGVRLHDLRHYVATTMLHDGVPVAEVAGVLGHTSIATTTDVYAHFLPGRGRESVSNRAARLDG